MGRRGRNRRKSREARNNAPEAPAATGAGRWLGIAAAFALLLIHFAMLYALDVFKTEMLGLAR